MHCEILWSAAGVRYSNKAITFLRELDRVAGRRAKLTDEVTGTADFLVVYGPTSPHGQQAIKRYAGKPWVALDLGYWDRVRTDYPMRVSINAVHPDEHLEDFGPRRWDARGVELRDDYDPGGHVLVAGTGRKSVRNSGQPHWDDQAVQRARQRFGRRVRYRPKPRNRMQNLHHPVQEDLRGAAYVITHHSNVGVDAIIQGIPVSTEQGAARWLYGNGLDSAPANEIARLDFLRRLAWWNWKRSEIPAFWAFIQDRIDERIR